MQTFFSRSVAHRSARRQSGMFTLATVTVLSVAMVTLALSTQRNLLTEQRAAGNAIAAAQAFEAAEAGLDWAVAQLNRNASAGADCEPAEGAASFRARAVQVNATTKAFEPLATPLTPECTSSASGWQCSCPSGTASGNSSTPNIGSGAAFRVEFLAGDKPGVLAVRVVGCVASAGRCNAAAGMQSRAQAELRLAWLPALASNPSMALRQPAAGATAERFFASSFGLDRQSWASLPGVRHVRCVGDCTPALQAAAALGESVALLRVTGDARLVAPAQLGSADKPVLLVVDGRLELAGAVQITGVVHARSLQWQDVGTGRLRGALLSSTAYTGNAAQELAFDADVVARIQQAGGFAKVAGSWRSL